MSPTTEIAPLPVSNEVTRAHLTGLFGDQGHFSQLMDTDEPHNSSKKVYDAFLVFIMVRIQISLHAIYIRSNVHYSLTTGSLF